MTLTDLWIMLPLLILGCGALLVLLLGPVVAGRYSSLVAMACCAGAALWALQTPPAVTVSLGVAATPLARMFTVFFCLLAAAVLLISLEYNDRRAIQGEEYPATVLFATFGMVALASATSLLTLFLGLEAMTFGFYILVAMDLRRDSSSEAGLKYLLLGAVAAGFLSFGLALLYFASGTLQSAAALKLSVGDPLALTGWGLVLTGVAFKLSLVPAHLWTADVYQGSPAPVTAFLSTGSKAAAILFTVILLQAAGDTSLLRTPLLLLALLSMVLGNLAALRQHNIKRMLAYSSIAQMGYVALALVCGGSGGYQAALYYAVIYALMTFAAFGAVAVFERGGASSGLIDDYRGGGAREPVAAAVLALAMLALAGIPPTAGFTGKFLIFAAALRGGEIAAAVIGILTAAVSAYYYLRIVVQLYMVKADPDSHFVGAGSTGEKVLLVTIALLLLLTGLVPTPLLDLLILPGR